jgi:hypothetical protein
MMAVCNINTRLRNMIPKIVRLCIMTFFLDNGEKVPAFPSKEVRANTNCYITLLNTRTDPSTQPHTNTLKVFET